MGIPILARMFCRRLGSATVVTATALLLCSPAAAEDDAYLFAKEALKEGHYESAEAALNDLIILEPRAPYFILLGRVLTETGRCAEAKDAFQTAVTMTENGSALADQVTQEAETSIARLADVCPAYLNVICEPESLRVSIDDGPATECPTTALKVAAGAHSLVAYDGNTEVASVSVTVAGQATEKVVLTSGSSGGDPLALWGGVAAGVGAVGLIGGLVFEQVVLVPAVEDFDETPWDSGLRDEAASKKATTQILYVAGGVLTVTGATMMLISALSGDGEGAGKGTQVGVAPSADGGSLVIRGAW